MKYKVGDKVRVKTWKEMLKIGTLNSRNNIVLFSQDGYRESFVRSMEKYCGKIVEIREVYNYFYKIKEDNYYNYTDEMFEDIESIKITRKVKTYAWDSLAIKEQKNKLIDEWNINKFIDFLKKGEKKDGNI